MALHVTFTRARAILFHTRDREYEITSVLCVSYMVVQECRWLMEVSLWKLYASHLIAMHSVFTLASRQWTSKSYSTCSHIQTTTRGTIHMHNRLSYNNIQSIITQCTARHSAIIHDAVNIFVAHSLL